MTVEDQVKRKARFLAGHPEWQILSPDSIRSVVRGELEWRALGPGDVLIRASELSYLLDELGELTRPAGGNDG